MLYFCQQKPIELTTASNLQLDTEITNLAESVLGWQLDTWEAIEQVFYANKALHVIMNLKASNY